MAITPTPRRRPRAGPWRGRRSSATRHGPRPRGWTSWITTTDHKKIGIMYLYTVLAFFLLGGVEALLLRIQLGAPDNTFLSPEKYNQIFTMHGTTMIFLVVVPLWAGFANYLVPLMIGARDVAFPRINAWSYWMFLFGGIALYASVFFTPPEAGWFSYVPLSSKEYSPSGGQDAWIYMVHLTGLSSMLGAVNFIATIHNMRAPGMGWGRIPLFVWTILIYAYLIVLALSSLAATVTMLLLDRNFGTTLLRPDPGRVGAAVAAPLLVLRPPRGLHPRAARVRGLLRGAAGVRPQADLRLQGDRGLDRRHRVPRHARVGAPHVRDADVDRRAGVLHALELPDRGADRREDLQLGGDAVARHDRVPRAAPLLRGRHRHVPDGRDHRHLPGRLPGRLAADRHLLRRRALPLHGLRRRRLRGCRRRSTTGSRR